MQTETDRFLTSEEAQKLLRYETRQAFWLGVHNSGIPHVKLGPKRALFERAALEAWLNSRRVGIKPAEVAP